MPDPLTLQDIRSGFAARGDLAAITAYTGEREETSTFSKLGQVSTQLGAGLVANGLTRDIAVGLIGANSPAWIAAFWGIVAAGGTAVPLDAQNEDCELARMIEIGDCRLCFVTAALAERVHRIAPSSRLIILDRDSDVAGGTSWKNLLSPSSTDLPAATANDLAVTVFTSGTTGVPKAVPLTHGNLLTNVRALAGTRLVGPGDRALLPLPLYHVYPLTIGMITPLALGCGVVLPAGVSGPELIGAMRRGRATALVGVPRLYTAISENLRRGITAQSPPLAALSRALLGFARWTRSVGARWPARLLLRPMRRQLAPHLRLLVSGGAALNAEVEKTLDAMGWEVLTGYGLVETSSMLTFNPPGAAVPGSAGRPVPGMAVRIASPDADGIGEIEARGPSLFAGYRNDPTKTKDAFTQDGWFRTGDLGSIDGRGYLHIAARKTETIVLADGKKLFPEEFEAVYATAPLVREIALLGVDGALVGLVVPNLTAARDLGASRLGEALREGLAAKARDLPSHARLSGFAIAREALPRTQLGKIRRHFLPALYAAALRHEAAPGGGELSAEDRVLLEIPASAAVWRWLQERFPGKSLGPDTILQLDLAIDSLGWVELTLALERELAIVLREEEIARIDTVRDLLREASAAKETAIGMARATTQSLWLTPLGAALGLLRRVGEGVNRLVMRRAFRLRVEGLELLPLDDPILLCPNHASYLDPFALAAALPRSRLDKTYWGGWTGVAFNTRLRRLFSRIARIIPVDPDRAAVSGLAMGRLILERGWNLVWFPEGARSPDGTLQRFLPGVGMLVETRPVPIVPVRIEGSFAAWPLGQRFPRLRPLAVRFGTPIIPASLAADAPARSYDEKIAASVQRAVAELAG
jgi:long-chain acyl-CoA synthetase